MIVVGLTGGIGSGKTTVAEMFKEHFNVPIYFADIAAKDLMNSSSHIKTELTELFGNEAYIDGELNRAYLAKKVFSDKNYLERINAIVHPEVARHFREWLKNQDAPYVLKEAAIIFEHNKQDEYDLVITVIADEDKRIQRVIDRDNSSEEKVKAVIKNQLKDSEKAKLSDFVIVNNDLSSLKEQVEKIHRSILNYTTKS